MCLGLEGAEQAGGAHSGGVAHPRRTLSPLPAEPASLCSGPQMSLSSAAGSPAASEVGVLNVDGQRPAPKATSPGTGLRCATEPQPQCWPQLRHTGRASTRAASWTSSNPTHPPHPPTSPMQGAGRAPRSGSNGRKAYKIGSWRPAAP